MLAISKIDTMIWELEGACEVDHSVSQESITALVASCGRAHTEIMRLQKALTLIASGGEGQFQWSMTKAEVLARDTISELEPILYVQKQKDGS